LIGQREMNIQERLLDDMKAALKAGEKLRLETIRGVRAQIKNREIELGKPLDEEQVMGVLMNAAKKRKESIEQFTALNRLDRAKEEEQELEIIKQYLPVQMSKSDITSLVDKIINQAGATSSKDIGKVMALLMPQVKGKADGKIVQQIVKEKLSSL
jgi:uncharacterized protein YqeY